MYNRKYVVGFLFNEEKSKSVVLIQKTKPEWQKGYFNGVGGKVEKGESFEQAMVREFEEETGVRIENWKQYAYMGSSDMGYEIYIYKSFVPLNILFSVRTTTEEEIKIINIENIWNYPIISNLEWLIPLALDTNVINSTIAMIPD